MNKIYYYICNYILFFQQFSFCATFGHRNEIIDLFKIFTNLKKISITKRNECWRTIKRFIEAFTDHE